MIKSSELKVFSLSLLCVSILTACGGGNSIFENQGGAKDDKSAKDGTVTSGEDGTTTGPTLGPVDKINPLPTAEKFLTDKTTGIGQQSDMIVTSIKYGDDDQYGAVKFNQPGFLSEVCVYGKEKCKYPNETDETDETDDIKKKLEDQVVIRNINNRFLSTESINQIDTIGSFVDLPGPVGRTYNNYLVQKDPGLTTIKTLIKADGTKMPYGGSVGREFNGVILFQDKLKKDDKGKLDNFVNAYARDPAAAGWAYQTFAVFSNDDYNKRRDLNIGYQSFGQPTKIDGIPQSDHATYTGISHAYYNTDQVTSHNRIDVDFKNHTVKYRTTDIPYLHTFDADGKDIITEKPGYAVSADASIATKHNRFQGTARTQDGRLSGTLEGRFYGGNVEEVGGVYGLSGRDSSGKVHYVGGFGARR